MANACGDCLACVLYAEGSAWTSSYEKEASIVLTDSLTNVCPYRNLLTLLHTSGNPA